MKSEPERPSVYTPFLRRFTDERARDLADTIALYDKVREKHLASPWSHQQAIDRVNTYIADVISEIVELPHSPTLLKALNRCQTAVLALEVTIFSCPEIDWDNDVLSLKEQVDLRRFLRAKEYFLARDDHISEELAIALTSTFAGIIMMLPALPEAGDDPAFTVPLISLIEKPADKVGRIIGTICKHELADVGLFTELQDRFWENTCIATGANEEPRKPLITAADSKLAPRELVETYLNGTPFLNLFLTPVSYAIPQAVRFEHMHVVAGTGHGKTQCLQYMIFEDLIRALRDERQSIVVIDSQGSLIRNLSSCALFNPDDEESLSDRLVLIDPSDIDRPPALNLFNPGLDRLESYTPQQREVAFNSLVDVYGRFFGALLGAELTGRQSAIFRYLARLMLTIEGATIHTLIALMDDARPFATYIERLDATARRFFEKEFSRKGFNATRQQIKDRLYAVLSVPTFDRLFSAPRSKVNLFDCLNSGKIVLIDTAKGLLKDEGTAIFGRFMLALIEHAITERAAMSEAERNPVLLYMDEAHEYFDDTVETLLVEARKFNCGLTLAHQNLAQLSPRLRQIFMGNTSVKLAGGITEADARALAADMRTTSDSLLSMRKREDVRLTEFALSIRNVTSSALEVTLPLGFLEAQPRLDTGQREALLVRNRERIGYTPQSDTPESVAEPAEPIEMPDLSVAETAPEAEAGHREVQEQIKRAAQERGFATTIEQTVLDGAGNVDVSLEKGDLRIACEVSVTTKPDHERANVEKCLAAGYGQVWLTSPDSAHLDALRTAIVPALPNEVRDRVRFFSPNDLIGELKRLAAIAPPSRSTVLGYDVVVRHASVDTVQATERRKRLGAVLTRLRRQSKAKG